MQEDKHKLFYVKTSSLLPSSRKRANFSAHLQKNLLSLCKYNWHDINFPSTIPACPTWVPNSPTWNSTLVCIFIKKGKSSREKLSGSHGTFFTRTTTLETDICHSIKGVTQFICSSCSSLMEKENKIQPLSVKRWDRIDENPVSGNWFSGKNKGGGNKHISMKAFKACTITNKLKG